MIRFVSIAIVIWGLIVQPLLAAAMPAKLTTDSTHSSMAVDLVTGVDTSVHAGHHDDTAKSPGALQTVRCHKKSADDSSSEYCDKCDDDCVSGSCAVSCVIGGSVSAVHKLPVNFRLNSRTVTIIAGGSRSYWFPTRIFHPPKHA